MYAIDGGEVLTVMASVAPSVMRITSTNISVMIDLPFASMSYAREAATRLAFMGANVVLLRQTTDPPTVRSIVYYNDAIARAEAENYVSLLGPLEFVESKEVIDGVNLRIVLGNDFAAALGAGIGATTTTVAK
jgi:ketopantoate hydroxymethyltransferase